MATIHKLDRTKGLDLLIHTPGGDLTATESIVHYLGKMFGTDIRAIIPQQAMSAGTMLACACKEIVMGKQSSIGPIDPQFGGIPAQGVLEEFENAVAEITKDPNKIPLWQTIIGKYHPTFIGECKHAVVLAKTMVLEWLISNMLKREPLFRAKAQHIVDYLSDHATLKTHSRHIQIEDAKKIGLKIVDLEGDQTLQDLVLTVHHSYMHTFSNSIAVKIIENHEGTAIISNAK